VERVYPQEKEVTYTPSATENVLHTPRLFYLKAKERLSCPQPSIVLFGEPIAHQVGN
jgi:hypothetical protein